MPALQVRDFPADLYEQLKTSSERNHRSMAQQTVAFVEQGLMKEGDTAGLAGGGAASPIGGPVDVSAPSYSLF